ncbi:MAG: S1/P1 nuclease [Kangiellaceae bacterium]
MKHLVFSILLTLSTSVLALGQTGHRVTGAIADRHISPHTQKQIQKILGHQSLAEVSTYADEMRSSPTRFWQETASPYHYVTVPKGKTYQEVGAPKQGDAAYALSKFSKVVKSASSTKEEKAVALKFMVHIIGDLHQPLHAGNGLDRGGNDVKLKFYGKDTNLHRIWDTDLIERRHLSYSEWTDWLDKEITAADVNQWKSNDPMDWISESAKLRDTIYPKENSIGYTYQYNNMPIIKKRLKQAGIRIAHFLDELFKAQ